jgi:hypothetical protein
MVSKYDTPLRSCSAIVANAIQFMGMIVHYESSLLDDVRSRRDLIPQQASNLLSDSHDSLLCKSSSNNLNGDWCSVICSRVI